MEAYVFVFLFKDARLTLDNHKDLIILKHNRIGKMTLRLNSIAHLIQLSETGWSDLIISCDSLAIFAIYNESTREELVFEG
jgi:hypothetical protein